MVSIAWVALWHWMQPACIVGGGIAVLAFKQKVPDADIGDVDGRIAGLYRHVDDGTKPCLKQVIEMKKNNQPKCQDKNDKVAASYLTQRCRQKQAAVASASAQGGALDADGQRPTPFEQQTTLLPFKHREPDDACGSALAASGRHNCSYDIQGRLNRH